MIAQNKQILRHQLKQQRAALPESERQRIDQQIGLRLLNLSEYQAANVIFCYVGVGNEIDTTLIIADALQKRKTVGIPKCTEKGRMEVYPISNQEQLRLGKYQIPEPLTEEVPPLMVGQIEIAIIPCLACSRDGRRLGYGGGYYDRYLDHQAILKVALCRQNMLRDDIPVVSHDQSMDLIITEEGIIQTSPV